MTLHVQESKTNWHKESAINVVHTISEMHEEPQKTCGHAKDQEVPHTCVWLCESLLNVKESLCVLCSAGAADHVSSWGGAKIPKVSGCW